MQPSLAAHLVKFSYEIEAVYEMRDIRNYELGRVRLHPVMWALLCCEIFPDTHAKVKSYALGSVDVMADPKIPLGIALWYDTSGGLIAANRLPSLYLLG